MLVFFHYDTHVCNNIIIFLLSCQSNHRKCSKSHKGHVFHSVGGEGYNHLHEHQIQYRLGRGSTQPEDVYYSDIDRQASRSNPHSTSFTQASTVPVRVPQHRVPTSLKQQRSSGLKGRPEYNRSKSEGSMYHDLESPVTEGMNVKLNKGRSKLSLDSGVEPDYADADLRPGLTGRPTSVRSTDRETKESKESQRQIEDGCDTLGYLIVLPTEQNNTSESFYNIHTWIDSTESTQNQMPNYITHGA